MPVLPIILASSSQSRNVLLQRLQIPFTIDSPDIDERQHPAESAISLVLRLARNKASVVAARHPPAIVIGGDQVAVLKDEILGKPGNRASAYEQLQKISGQCVNFTTGLAVLNSETGNMQSIEILWKVYFRTFVDEEITAYLDKESPYHCACSFTSEKLGIALVERFEGEDFSALMGLPLLELLRMLRNEDISPLLSF